MKSHLEIFGVGLFIVAFAVAGCDVKQQSKAKSEIEQNPNTKTQTDDTPTNPKILEQVAADVGVAKKGRALDNKEGMIVTPVKKLFEVKEKTVFQIQIPQAIQLYKALKGHAPKSHDEFMKVIIKQNQLKLPELPEGQRYVYVPEKEKLMVERPSE